DCLNLKWIEWNGSLPNGAVSIWNEHASRIDYVSATLDGEAGFYSQEKGPYCYYPYADKEHCTSSFKILVNEDDFEFLDWKSGFFGTLPENSVTTFPGAIVFVGKNKYGLGKVVPRFQAFFGSYNGKEYCYQTYNVLTVSKDYHTQKISNVRYLMNEAKCSQGPPEILASSKVINNNPETMKKTVTLSKTTLLEQSWDIGRPTKNEVTATISSGIPVVSGTSVTFAPETTFDWKEGVTCTKSVPRNLSLEVDIPPSCEREVVMEGKQMTIEIPFIATLTRIYRNGKTATTTIRGTFKDVQIEDVKAVENQCKAARTQKDCTKFGK
uniref:Natterin-4 n=1 Tax=Latimeria chalumnae TaxID=7897 RepID=H3AG52_LATCH